MAKRKAFMIFDAEREYGIVEGREEERYAKESLRRRGKKKVGSFEWGGEW